MGSSRMWFSSGAVLSGIGAAMLCGAGTAGADTGDAAGSTARQVHAAVTSAAAGVRGAVSAAAVKPAAVLNSAAALKPAAVLNSAAALKPAAVLKTAAAVKPAAAAVAPRRANRADPVRPVRLAPTPAVSTPVAPTTDPVDPAQFAGTYYEQGSVKQFFSIGLVNTKATYTLNPDGTIRVENSGNYFFNRGPKSSIVGSAVPVNETNSALNVGFFGSSPSANPPGNYTILAKAPDYSWVIVSDPSGQSGYILTRDKNITPEQYQQLLAEARSLGVRGTITPTVQYR
ncbi:MAG: lipocalin family protein [Mycobacterium sp.]|nr:lipocalin family protein [Mycobacterium sp.]